MKLIDIKKAIVSKLRITFPNVNIPSIYTRQGFKKPAFFVEVIPVTTSNENEYHSNKFIAVDIHYFSETEENTDNLIMADDLKEIFNTTLEVLDRQITIEEISYSIIDGVLHYKFDLEFIDSIDYTEEHELMAELEMKGV